MSFLSNLLRRNQGERASNTDQGASNTGSGRPLKPGRRARGVVHRERKEVHEYNDEAGHHRVEETTEVHASGPLPAVQRAVQGEPPPGGPAQIEGRSGVAPEDVPQGQSGPKHYPGLERAREEAQRFGEAVLSEMPEMLRRAVESWRRAAPVTPEEAHERASLFAHNLQYLIGCCRDVLVRLDGTPTFDDLEYAMGLLDAVLGDMEWVDGRPVNPVTRIAAASQSTEYTSTRWNAGARRDLARQIKTQAINLQRELTRIKGELDDPARVTPQILQSAYVAVQRLVQRCKAAQNNLWNRLKLALYKNKK